MAHAEKYGKYQPLKRMANQNIARTAENNSEMVNFDQCPNCGEHSTDETERWVDIDIYCGDNRAERLTFQEGDDFEAEVYCDDYRMEVVEIRPVDTETDRISEDD